MKEFLKQRLSKKNIDRLKSASRIANSGLQPFLNAYGRYAKTPYKLFRNKDKGNRFLEIGPGPERISGFETMNVVFSSNTDYVADASKALPFPENSFSLIYASHILEHIPWYQVENALREWLRILEPGGHVEIWVPDGLLIAKTWIDAEDGNTDKTHLDGWYKFNPQRDPAVWANGRVFSYGDGGGNKGSPNWHMSLYSPRLLKKLMQNAGFLNIERMERQKVRGYDHGWINLGMRGTKA